MMDDQGFRHFIKTYSGVPTRCMLVLGWTMRAMTKTEIQEWASADNEAVKKFVKMALLDNYIISIAGNPAQYQLSSLARQLPFFMNLPGPISPLPSAAPEPLLQSVVANDPTAENPHHSGKTAVPVVVDLDIKESFKESINQQQQGVPTAEKPQLTLEEKFLEILLKARVWQSTAKTMARALAVGAIAMSIPDVLAVVAWGGVEATHLGAFVRHHISLGNFATDPLFTPPIEDFDLALRWALATPFEREDMFAAHCPICQVVIYNRFDGRFGRLSNICPNCGTTLLVTDLPTVAELPLYMEPDPEPAEVLSPAADLDPANVLQWKAALGELQVQLMASTFHAYLADLVLIDYDPARHIFILAANEPTVRDFVEARLASTIQRTLSAICHEPTTVRLVNRYGGTA